jgi:photosystem II stability/assembly factor-like uncharacterized protein
MQKVIILVLGLSLTAASCNILGGGSGSKGALKSDDAGKNFVAANTIAEKKNISGVSVNVLTFDSSNPDVIYLGSSSGIFKTEDGAATWRQILTGIAVSDIASDPVKSNTIYAVGLAGRNGKIIKSPDGGSTWADIYTEPSRSDTVTTVAVSKANSRIVLAGLSTGEIIRSTDEGQTWQVVTDLQDPVFRIRFYNTSSAYALGLTKGLNKSSDQGSNWSGLPVSDLQLPAGSAVSSVRRYLDLAFDQKLSGVIFTATEQGLLRTVDDGVTWSVMYLPVRDASLKVTAVAVNPNDSNGLFITIGSTLFKSANGGVTWETVKLPSNQTVRQILINPTTPNVIYLGLGDNK